MKNQHRHLVRWMSMDERVEETYEHTNHIHMTHGHAHLRRDGTCTKAPSTAAFPQRYDQSVKRNHNRRIRCKLQRRNQHHLQSAPFRNLTLSFTRVPGIALHTLNSYGVRCTLSPISHHPPSPHLQFPISQLLSPYSEGSLLTCLVPHQAQPAEILDFRAYRRASPCPQQ